MGGEREMTGPPEENIKRIAASLCGYAPGDKRGMEQERATLQNILLHLPKGGLEARQ